MQVDRKSGKPVRVRRRAGSNSADIVEYVDREDGHKGSSSKKSLRRITIDELKISFENLIGIIENCDKPQVLTSSVVEMLKTMYTWVVFDSDTQISIPYEAGGVPKKMWPHGSRVDSRRKTVHMDSDDYRQLKKLDDDEMSSVTGSVVSSNRDTEQSMHSMGRVTGPLSRGHYSEVPHTLSYRQPSQHPPQYGPPPGMVPRMPQRIIPEGPYTYVQRGSVINGPNVQSVQETPEMRPAEIQRNKKDRKLRTGTTREQRIDEAEEGLVDEY